MTQSLFTSETPAADATDGAPGITTGTTFRATVDGTVTHIRFYVGAATAGTYTGLLWERTANDTAGGGTGSLLASDTFTGTPSATAWNTIELDPPITITAGITYRVGRHHATDYVATNSFFVSPLVSDDLVADENGETGAHLGLIRQGTFKVDASPAYPTDVGSSACYFVDVVFVPDSGLAAVEPDSLAIPLALGEPTVALGLTAAPTGLSIPLALGEPAVSIPAPAPTGLAIPITFGEPTVGTSVTPESLLIGIEFGTPTAGPTVSSVVVGSWYGLSAVLQEARQLRAEDDAELARPSACPHDGEPLLTGPRGELYCPYDGWRP